MTFGLDQTLDESESCPVPAAGSELQEWTPVDTGYHSRAELRRQRGAYRSTVPARIEDWRPDLPPELSADVEDATRALVAFDAHAVHALGVDDPTLGPMAAILLRTESSSSSQIENLTTSARQLALAEIDESLAQNALTVMGNVRAMEAALRLAARIDAESILSMHQELLSRQPGAEDHAGVFRDQLVWIGKPDAGPLGAEFIAPQPGHVPGAVEDLMRFAHREDLPILVQIAVTHAQFETIHPFVDGNGRTGRALAQAMLRATGVASQVTVPVSAGLLVNAERYFEALTSFREGDAAPIIRRFAEASRFAAVSGTRLVDALAEQLKISRDSLAGVRSDSRAWEVLPRLIGQPVVNARYLKVTMGLGDASTKRILDLLTERGVLTESTGARRNRVWHHVGILGVLDAYAQDVRRPGRR